MKHLKLLLLLALCLPAFSATTTVSQTIQGPDGSLASGTVLIRITAPCKSGVDYIGDKTIMVRFAGGAFSVPLVPNDTCVPSGTSYTVAWLLTGGTTRTQTWVVPTSGSPVTVDSVVVTTTPTPTWMISLNQLSQGGAATGQTLAWNGLDWAPSSAGTATVSSVGLTMPNWFSVANSPVTTSGTLAVTAATGQTSHQVIGTCGSATSFSPCALVAADIPTLNQNTTGTAGGLSGSAFTGDVSNSGNTVTLNTVNSGSGSCGDSTHVCQVTTNGRGLVTTQSAVAIPTSLPPNGTAGGDLTGTYPNPSVAEITETWTAGSGGVTANTLVKLDTTTANQVVATTTSDVGWHGVAMSTVSNGSPVSVRRSGPVQILLDSGTATIGNAAILSTTNAGYIHDSGTTRNGVSILNSIGVIKTACSSSCSGTLITVELTGAEKGGQIPAAQVTGTLSNNTNGNAATATALAATPTTCSAGNYPLGIVASGNATGCTAVPTALPPNGSAGGDLGGTYPNPTVTNGSHITNASIPNSGLVNTATTVNGQTCTLGSSCAVPLSAINPQTATYQVVAGDFSNYKTITVASGTFTVTLVASGSQPAAGQYVNVWNYGSGVVTIARSGQNINGGTSSLSLPAGSATQPTSATISSDGTNYFATVNVPTPMQIGLGNVTNDAQTKAAVVPNTAPSAGQIAVGNAGGTAYAPQTVGGDGTLSSAGSLAVNNGSHITNASIPNSGLVNTATTVNGQTCTLGSTCTVPLSAVNAQTATYQVVAGDFSNYKTITVASGTFTITLVASGSQPAAGQYIRVWNYGSGVVTIARSGQNLNGGTSSLSLPAGSAAQPTSAEIESDGTNYFATVNVPTPTQIGLGNVTNDAQTKAAVMPNTAPSSGQIPVGNAGGTAYAPQAVGGDATLSSAGSLTVTKINGTSFSGTNGDLVSFGASNTPADSGVVAANAVTATSAASAANQVCVAGGASKTCSYIDFPDTKFIPSANCNNTTAGNGWSIGSGGTVTCRAGSNSNLGGYISITDTSSTFAQFTLPIPLDWNSGANPYIRVYVASTDTTSGHTIIPQIKTACVKGDGTTTDDVAYNSAHSLTTITLNTTASQFWASATQMNSGDVTACVAGGLMVVQVGRATDTATSAQFYGAEITFPRRLVFQGN